MGNYQLKALEFLYSIFLYAITIKDLSRMVNVK